MKRPPKDPTASFHLTANLAGNLRVVLPTETKELLLYLLPNLLVGLLPAKKNI